MYGSPPRLIRRTPIVWSSARVAASWGLTRTLTGLGGDSPDGGPARQVRCVEDVSSCLRVSAEAADDVIDVGNPPQEVVRTTGQNEPSVRSCLNGCSAWLVSDPSRRLTPASAQSVPRLMAPACSVLELRRVVGPMSSVDPPSRRQWDYTVQTRLSRLRQACASGPDSADAAHPRDPTSAGPSRPGPVGDQARSTSTVATNTTSTAGRPARSGSRRSLPGAARSAAPVWACIALRLSITLVD